MSLHVKIALVITILLYIVAAVIGFFVGRQAAQDSYTNMLRTDTFLTFFFLEPPRTDPNGNNVIIGPIDQGFCFKPNSKAFHI